MISRTLQTVPLTFLYAKTAYGVLRKSGLMAAIESNAVLDPDVRPLSV